MSNIRIHTLGPKVSDSYSVAESLLQAEEDEIVEYASFDSLIHHVTQEDLQGNYLLFPAGFQSARRDYGWKEFNYEYWDKLDIVDVFARETRPMVLIKNFQAKENRAALHPATVVFFEKYAKKRNENSRITLSDSKHKAFEQFRKQELKYTITNLDVYEESFETEEERAIYKVEESYNPKMVWIVYKVL